ncbi:MAG: YkgJ family cysteine cluster protein [Myxococcales bacterium]|nr:YkgJ family cysteine cluster protein [Myxococcales bacterium]
MTPPAKRRPGLLRPLIVREGARYTCFGDGMCCSDLHALGPVSREERKRLAIVHPGVTGYDGLANAHVLATRPDGTCAFLDDEALCALHEPMGGMLKPKSCHRFPLGVTATPSGGRVILEHRCSCINVGVGAPLTVERAEPQLTVGVRIRPSHAVEKLRVDRRLVSFATYLKHEAPLLEGLEGRAPLEQVLDREPFGPLAGLTWAEVGERLAIGGGDSRFHDAMRIVAALLRDRFAGEPFGRDRRDDPDHLGPYARRWAAGFARAQARSKPRPVRDVYAAWMADHVWSLFWTPHASLDQVRKDLATRYVLARDLERRLRRKGLRADVAAAEAVLITDLAGTSERWHAVVHRMR